MIVNIKTKLILAIVFVLSACLIFFLVSPFLEEIKRGSAEIILQKQNVDSLSEKEENLNDFKNKYREIGPNLEKIDSLFVDVKTPISFINFLDKTSEDCGVKLNISSSIASRSAGESLFFLNFQVNSTGLFSDTMRFIEKIENSQYLIEIKNINIRKLTQSKAEGGQKTNKNIDSNAVEANFSLDVLAK